MVDVTGLNPKHFEELRLVARGQWSAIDGRRMRVLVRRGFATAGLEPFTWALTKTGKQALKEVGRG